MSHFLVLVVGDVEEQLAPFQENNMGNCPIEYMKFHDEEAEYRAQFETGTIEVVVGPKYNVDTKEYDDTILGWRNDPQFQIYEGSTQFTKIPARANFKEIPFKDYYNGDFTEFMNDWAGMKVDPMTGRYGRWDNPNFKWDWYKVGGRYAGRLWKKGVDYPVDTALVRELDMETILAERKAERLQHWARAMGEKDRGEAWLEMCWDVSPGMTKAEYVAKVDTGITAHAVVKDGHWAEKGEMGWWGNISNPKNDAEWKAFVADFVSKLSPDDRITMVDCHI